MNELVRFSESESEFSGGKKCKLQHNFNMAAIEKSIAGLFCFEKFRDFQIKAIKELLNGCLLYTSPSPRDKRQSRMPSSA